MLLRHADEFNLTGEQEEQLNQLRLTHELEKVDLQAALKKAKITFRALARDHDAAESDIMDAIDKIAFHEANLRKMRYRHLKAAHGVLGEDQRNSLKSYHKQHMREKLKSFRDGRRGPSA